MGGGDNRYLHCKLRHVQYKNRLCIRIHSANIFCLQSNTKILFSLNLFRNWWMNDRLTGKDFCAVLLIFPGFAVSSSIANMGSGNTVIGFRTFELTGQARVRSWKWDQIDDETDPTTSSKVHKISANLRQWITLPSSSLPSLQNAQRVKKCQPTPNGGKAGTKND